MVDTQQGGQCVLQEINPVSSPYSLCIPRETWWKLAARRESQHRAGWTMNCSVQRWNPSGDFCISETEMSQRLTTVKSESKTRPPVFQMGPLRCVCVAMTQWVTASHLDGHSWACSDCKVNRFDTYGALDLHVSPFHWSGSAQGHLQDFSWYTVFQWSPVNQTICFYPKRKKMKYISSVFCSSQEDTGKNREEHRAYF